MRIFSRGWMTRAVVLFIGAVMLQFGLSDLLAPRARYVRSSPEPGATLAAPPPAVTVSFSDELSPDSEISVRRTISLSPSGEKNYSREENVATVSRLEPADPHRRSLRADLAQELPGGLYVVNWSTIAARGRAQRFGTFYFGIGMPVPANITRDMRGAIRERDYKRRGRRATLISGVLLIALGVAQPWLPRRR
jgi:methionine-rich copper-binding protein CopC